MNPWSGHSTIMPHNAAVCLLEWKDGFICPLFSVRILCCPQSVILPYCKNCCCGCCPKHDVAMVISATCWISPTVITLACSHRVVPEAQYVPFISNGAPRKPSIPEMHSPMEATMTEYVWGRQSPICNFNLVIFPTTGCSPNPHTGAVVPRHFSGCPWMRVTSAPVSAEARTPCLFAFDHQIIHRQKGRGSRCNTWQSSTGAFLLSPDPGLISLILILVNHLTDFIFQSPVQLGSLAQVRVRGEGRLSIPSSIPLGECSLSWGLRVGPYEARETSSWH